MNNSNVSDVSKAFGIAFKTGKYFPHSTLARSIFLDVIQNPSKFSTITTRLGVETEEVNGIIQNMLRDINTGSDRLGRQTCMARITRLLTDANLQKIKIPASHRRISAAMEIVMSNQVDYQNKFKNIIADHLRDGCSVSDIASTYNVDPRDISKVIHSMTLDILRLKPNQQLHNEIVKPALEQSEIDNHYIKKEDAKSIKDNHPNIPFDAKFVNGKFYVMTDIMYKINHAGLSGYKLCPVHIRVHEDGRLGTHRVVFLPDKFDRSKTFISLEDHFKKWLDNSNVSYEVYTLISNDDIETL